jgi:type IV secretory pathway VirJ component
VNRFVRAATFAGLLFGSGLSVSGLSVSGLFATLAHAADTMPADVKTPEYKPTRVEGTPLYPVHYAAPAAGKTINGLIIMISGDDGWDAQAAALAHHLADEGEVVVGLELPIYRAALQTDNHDCTLVNRDIEVLARDVEKDLPFAEYRPPVVVGIGAGSGIAYAAAGTELPNTIAGAIALGFDPVIDVGHKLCLPLAAEQPTSGTALRYAPVTDHETPFLFTPSPEFAAPDGGMAAFVAAMKEAHVIQSKGDDIAAVDEALRQIPRVGTAEASVDGLPLVEIPASPTAPPGHHPLVIFYSGDGGWRDIDKKIGGYFADQGYPVVGVDSLRYFWRRKEPKEMAADLDRLIRHYRGKEKGNGVDLVGYSFGADLIPFMYNRLSPDTRADIRMITLLGISDRASFEIRLQGILGARNTDGPPTLPELEKIKTIPIQCVYGDAEQDSVCASKNLDGIVTRVELAGGHHFDGDYQHTADLIIAADKARAEKAK